MLSELDKESKEVARLLLVESEVQELKVVLDEVQAKLKNTTLELDKTQTRNKNVERHKKVKCSSRKHIKYVEYSAFTVQKNSQMWPAFGFSKGKIATLHASVSTTII